MQVPGNGGLPFRLTIIKMGWFTSIKAKQVATFTTRSFCGHWVTIRVLFAPEQKELQLWQKKIQT